MRNLYKIGIGFVLFMIISAGVLFFWWQAQKQILYSQSFKSSYGYHVELTADSTLSNVTLYLPLPVINNTSSVGMDIIEHDFNDDDPSWKYALVDTEHGLMLSMKNEKIEPQYTTRSKDSKKILRQSIDSRTILFSNKTIDTMNPLGKEMVLMPKYKLTYLGPTASQPNASVYYHDNSKVYNYDSRIYAHYETLPDTNVSIFISTSGCNQWWIGGWQSNNFREDIEIKLSGPQDGWATINGQLVTGEGTYESPFSLS
ncbi:MAG: hypothetical protein QG670_654 [Thermoproteota archaeon]|nr:hypothetical protein [Thermoproteota archaeon]